MIFFLKRTSSITLSAVCLCFFFLTAEVSAEKPMPEWSVFAYGGKWSDNSIGEIVRGITKIKDSYVWACGISRHAYKVTDNLKLEVELNVARHTGKQEHFEINAAASLRMWRFPWDRHVDTTLSYGLGPSYARRRPPIEHRSSRKAEQVLVFMPVEITFSPPERDNQPWETLVRVHHRSGAYGVVSDARGSNFITAGLRYRF